MTVRLQSGVECRKRKERTRGTHVTYSVSIIHTLVPTRLNLIEPPRSVVADFFLWRHTLINTAWELPLLYPEYAPLRPGNAASSDPGNASRGRLD